MTGEYRPGTERGESTARLCQNLLAKWDSMFLESVDPTRARRMEAILEALRTRIGRPSAVLDLGSGPGPLAVRMLQRFPGCRVVAVDADPVLVRVGSQALHRFRRRITWVRADLRKRRWTSGLPVHRFDAAVSSLALHWLEGDEVRALYRDLRRILRPGGFLINADYLPLRRPEQPLDRRRRAVGETERGVAVVRRFRAEWEKWWGALEREPSMPAAFQERQLRMPGAIPPRRTTGPRVPVSLEFHQGALRDAGFRETGVVWQEREFRALTGLC